MSINKQIVLLFWCRPTHIDVIYFIDEYLLGKYIRLTFTPIRDDMAI